MNDDIITQDDVDKKIFDAYKKHSYIFGNKMYVFGNKTPLIADIRAATQFLMQNYPDEYIALEKTVSGFTGTTIGDAVLLIDTLSHIENTLTSEQQVVIDGIAVIISVVRYLKSKTSTSEKE